VIIGVFGLPRSGKSYWACYQIYFNYIQKGIPVYSNIPLRGAFKLSDDDIINGFPLKNGAVVFLDEVQNYANSRSWDKLSDNLYFIFSQGGKYDLKLYYTAQDSSRVDKTLREVSNYYYDVRKLIADNPLKSNKDNMNSFFKRIVIIDRYSSNYEYSFKRNAKRSFFILRKSFFPYFDSFYAINRFGNSINESKRVFEKWDI
jgi:hypothetical protein